MCLPIFCCETNTMIRVSYINQAPIHSTINFSCISLKIKVTFENTCKALNAKLLDLYDLSRLLVVFLTYKSTRFFSNPSLLSLPKVFTEITLLMHWYFIGLGNTLLNYVIPIKKTLVYNWLEGSN